MDESLELESVRGTQTDDPRWRWRHPLVRQGAWSRIYISKGAALAGAAMALKHARKEAKDGLGKEGG